MSKVMAVVAVLRDVPALSGGAASGAYCSIAVAAAVWGGVLVLVGSATRRMALSSTLRPAEDALPDAVVIAGCGSGAVVLTLRRAFRSSMEWVAPEAADATLFEGTTVLWFLPLDACTTVVLAVVSALPLSRSAALCFGANAVNVACSAVMLAVAAVRRPFATAFGMVHSVLAPPSPYLRNIVKLISISILISFASSFFVVSLVNGMLIFSAQKSSWISQKIMLVWSSLLLTLRLAVLLLPFGTSSSAPCSCNTSSNVAALLDLQNSATPSISLGWNASTTTVCDWSGITCEGDFVTEIQLSNRNMSGYLPQSLYTLVNVRVINMSYNALVGCVSADVGNIQSLSTLDLCWNSLGCDFPGALWGLPSLRYLDLSHNYVSGSLPDTIVWNVSVLAHLDITSNRVVPPLPSSLGNLSMLEYLDVSSLLYVSGGTLPVTLGGLSRLKVLRANSLNLQGSLPASFGQLTVLEQLALEYNSLNGSIPQSWCNMMQLRTLTLFNNALNGSIPSCWGNLKNLQQLSFYANFLSGTLPLSIGSLTQLTSLDVSYNSLIGEIPVGIGGMVSLQYLLLGSNPGLGGSLPVGLCNLTKLLYLGLSYCRFSGTLPACIGNLQNLLTLVLYNNSFIGSVPSSVGDIRTLVTVQLAYNNFSGSIASFIQYFPKLRNFNLMSNSFSGTIPYDLLARMPSVVQVRLDSNRFVGSLPNLESPLLSGVVASPIGQCAFNDNNLTGILPQMAYRSKRCRMLSLANNNFTGTLPPAWGAAARLNTLIIANNSLSGTLPPAWALLSTLYYVTIVGNRFCGGVPLSWVNHSLADGSLPWPIDNSTASVSCNSTNYTFFIVTPNVTSRENTSFLALCAFECRRTRVNSFAATPSSAQELWQVGNATLEAYLLSQVGLQQRYYVLGAAVRNSTLRWVDGPLGQSEDKNGTIFFTDVNVSTGKCVMACNFTNTSTTPLLAQGVASAVDEASFSVAVNYSSHMESGSWALLRLDSNNSSASEIACVCQYDANESTASMTESKSQSVSTSSTSSHSVRLTTTASRPPLQHVHFHTISDSVFNFSITPSVAVEVALAPSYSPAAQAAQALGTTAAVVSAVTGGDVSNANTLVLLSTLDCGARGAVALSMAVKAVSLLGEYGFAVMALANIGLLIGITVLHFIVVVVAGKCLHNGESWQTVSAERGLRFPKFSFFLCELFVPQVLLGAGAALTSTSLSPLLTFLAVVMLLMVAVIVVGREVLLHSFVAPHVTVHPYSTEVVTVLGRLPAISVLTPTHYWQPKTFCKTMGSLFQKMTRRELLVIGGLEFWLSLITSSLVVLSSQLASAGCSAVSSVLALIFAIAACFTIFVHPYRLPLDNAAVPLNYLCFSLVCVGKVLCEIYRGTATETKLRAKLEVVQIIQSVAMVLRLLSGIYVSWLDSRLYSQEAAERLKLPFSCDTPMLPLALPNEASCDPCDATHIPEPLAPAVNADPSFVDAEQSDTTLMTNEGLENVVVRDILSVDNEVEAAARQRVCRRPLFDDLSRFYGSNDDVDDSSVLFRENAL